MQQRRNTAYSPGWLAGLALAGLFTLSACGNTDEQTLPQYDPAPSVLESPAPEVDRQTFRLPLQFTDAPVVNPGWQTPPQYTDGVFLSAEHAEDVLTFRAVDSSGTLLWEADRPLSCTGFTITSHDDLHYAVLTDIDAEVQSLGNTVASAYDLHSGERVWGPVDVPGPHIGPGTVFAAPPEQAMGASDAKVVLDPASGDIIVDEREHEVKVLGEFHGTVLTVDAQAIQAHRAADLATGGLEAEPLWTVPVEDHGWTAENLTARSPVGLPDPSEAATSPAVLLGTDDTDRALVDLTSAEVLAEGLSDAGQDPTSQSWVMLGETLTGYGPTGQTLYDEPNDGLEFRGIGAAMAYLENSDGDLEARNVVTGQIGRAYDPDDTGTLAVPTGITATGAGILEAEGSYYLATVPTVEQPEPEEP